MFRNAVITFLTAFCVCFLLGAWQGWEDKRDTTEEEFLIETAIAHMRYGHLPETAPDRSDNLREIGSGGDIQYFCNGAPYFTFDLSTLLETENSHPATKPTVLSFEGIEKVVEGATGFHLYELARGTLVAVEERPSQLYEARKVIITVTGAVSGYFVGRLLTSRQRVPCDAPQLVEKLADASSAFSNKARKEFCRKRLEGVKLIVDRQNVALVDLVDQRNLHHHLPLRLDYEIHFINPDDVYEDHYQEMVFKDLAELRGRMSLTDYKPTSQEYMMVALLPTTAMQILSQNPSAANLAAGIRENPVVTYDGPYDPNDIIASYEHTNLFSERFLLFILWLSLGAAVVFLVALAALGLDGIFRRG